MEVLGRDIFIKKVRNFKAQRRPEGQTPPSKKVALGQKIGQIEQKRRNPNNKSKKIITYEYTVEDFKQNNLKQNFMRHAQQLDKINSNKQLLMRPFSSVVNRALHSDPMNLQHRNFQSQSQFNEKKNEQQHGPRCSSKEIVLKLVEDRLNNIIENKRKSISYRVPGPTIKENNINSENRKNTYDHTNENQRKQASQTEERFQCAIAEQQLRSPHFYRHKSSHSFMIRKKINSNMLQNNKRSKDSNKTIHCLKRYRKDGFVKNENHTEYIDEDISRRKGESQPTSRFKASKNQAYEQLKSLKQKLQIKDIHIKPTPIKPVKSIKIRVNKLSKQHEPITYYGNSTQPNNQPMSQKQQSAYKTNNVIKSHQVSDNSFQHLKVQPQDKHETNEQRNRSQNGNSDGSHKNDKIFFQHSQPTQSQKNISQQQKQKQMGQQQVQVPKYKQKQAVLEICEKQAQEIGNIKSRKNKINSIRAIKNYYKQLQNQERQSIVVEQRQIATYKKRQKQMACLTHKIKWGNVSKKKLYSERGLQLFHVNPVLSEFNISQSLGKKEQRQQSLGCDQKQQNKIAFFQGQLQQSQRKQQNKTKRNQQNPCNSPKMNLAQTINSKQFMGSIEIPDRIGSKQLLLFQDPGISAIINTHNSRHQALLSPRVFTTIQKYCNQQQQNNGLYMQNLSPVMKKQRPTEQPNLQTCDIFPIESLQELYFELQSHKQNNQKPIQEYSRMDSYQELFKG